MKKKFLILTLLIVLLITSVFSVKSLAASGDDGDYQVAVTMTANNQKVASGGEVLITVKVSNLKFSDTGFNKFKAYINYDTDVFEKLTESSIEGCDDWTPQYNEGTNIASLIKTSFQKTAGEIMQISLKTKEGLEDGVRGEVTLSTIVIGNDAEETNADNCTTTITIGNSASGVVTPTNTANATRNTPIPLNLTSNRSIPVNNISNDVANNAVSNNSVANNAIQVVNELEDDMPYTGFGDDGLSRIIIGVIFISLVIYIKIERMNRDIK